MIFIFDNGLINIGKESYELCVEATDHSYSIVLKTTLGDRYLLNDLGDETISMDFAEVITNMLFDSISECISNNKEVISMTACFDNVMGQLSKSHISRNHNDIIKNCKLRYTALEFVKKYLNPTENATPREIEHESIVISKLDTIADMPETIPMLFELITKENKSILLLDSIENEIDC